MASSNSSVSSSCSLLSSDGDKVLVLQPPLKLVFEGTTIKTTNEDGNTVIHVPNDGKSLVTAVFGEDQAKPPVIELLDDSVESLNDSVEFLAVGRGEGGKPSSTDYLKGTQKIVDKLKAKMVKPEPGTAEPKQLVNKNGEAAASEPAMKKKFAAASKKKAATALVTDESNEKVAPKKKAAALLVTDESNKKAAPAHEPTRKSSRSTKGKNGNKK